MSFAGEVLRSKGLGLSSLGPVGGAAAAGGLVSKSWGTVPEGYRGVRTRLGKVPKYEEDRPKQMPLEPGFHFTMPLTHSIKLINTENRANTGRVTVPRDEGLLDIEAVFIWQVLPEGDNPYRALFHVNDGEDLTQIITGICRAGLYRVMTDIDSELRARPVTIYNKVNEVSLNKLIFFGVALNSVEIQEVHPNTEAMNAYAIREGIKDLGSFLLAQQAATHPIGNDNGQHAQTLGVQ